MAKKKNKTGLMVILLIGGIIIGVIDEAGFEVKGIE